MLLLKNCKLIPELTEGENIDLADILIEDGRIVSINICGNIEYNCPQIDIDKKTVIPGMIDMHVHLFYTHPQIETLFVPKASRPFECLRYAKALLNRGFTTIRDVGDDHTRPATALRKAIDEKLVMGPRIIECGQVLCPPEVGMKVFGNLNTEVTGAQEVRKACRVNFQKGAQFIKMYGSGSLMCQGSAPGVRILERDEIEEAVKIAASRNSYVAMHCHGEEAIDLAVDCGVRTLEHASFISEKTLRKISGREDVGVVPTLSVYSELIDNEQGSNDVLMKKASDMIEKVYASLKKAKEHNALIGWGTDVDLNGFLRAPEAEFKLRKEKLGYSNIEILKQATINSAKLMGLDNEIGSIAKGKIADLVVVDGDPVVDISVMYKEPSCVFVKGELLG